MLSFYVRVQLIVSRLLAAHQGNVARLANAHDGQAMVEYAMLLFFIIFILLVATRFLSGKVTGALSTIANSI